MNKPMTQAPPSRQQIASWVHSIINEIPLNFKIEELGKGVIYCRLLNHYFPGVILINRIIWHPKSQYENMLNLRILQNALAQLKIILPLDPIRLSKQKLNDNWTFMVSLHRYLNQYCQDSAQINNYQEQIKTSNFYSNNQTSSIGLGTPKRTIEKVYPDMQYSKQPLFPIENQLFQVKSPYNASKYSVGKLYKEPMMNQANSSPNKGKWSVNSHMFQNNLVPIIDRIKEILLKSSNNTEKIRQVKLLLNIPLTQEVVVKIQEDEANPIKIIWPKSIQQEESIKTNTSIIQNGIKQVGLKVRQKQEIKDMR